MWGNLHSGPYTVVPVHNIYMTKKTEDFGVLLQEYFTQIPAVDSLIEGSIISISNGAVRIDINGLIVGIVRGQELFAESPEYANVQVGETVQATVVEQENENGEMELSFRIAGHQKIWEKLAEYLEKESVIEAKIVHANKGGLMMKVCGIDGFMPVSQLAPDNYPRVPGGDKNRILEQLQKLIGQTLQVKILDIQRNDEKLIVSEKAVWEDAQKSILDEYTIGDIVEGEISALTSFGAFIKFGQNLEGLIHISEIVWQRIDHPKDVLKIGDKVKAQIIDLNKSKIYLSVKRLKDDPWKTVKDTYKEGQKVEGTIHKIEPFGLMVKLDDHIHGLAHISEVSNSPVHDVTQLKEMFSIGEVKTFDIITIDPTEHRLGLRVDGVKRTNSSKKPVKKVEKEESEVVTE